MKNNGSHDVYLFGQILGTHSFLLKDGFLKPDQYSEIEEQYFLQRQFFLLLEHPLGWMGHGSVQKLRRF